MNKVGTCVDVNFVKKTRRNVGHETWIRRHSV